MKVELNSYTEYRRDIDFLRGIAILAVLLFHFFPKALPGGYLGVDVFFVISGYLITKGIVKDQILKKFSMVKFFKKRIDRLLPPLILVLSFTLLVGWFYFFSDEFRQLGKHLFASSIFLNNFVLNKEAGYFDVLSEFKPLLHLWSLSVEEQFYFIWPTIILFALRKRTISIIFALIMISWGLNFAFTLQGSSSVFFLPHFRFWEIILGALGAIFELKHRLVFSDFKKIIMVSLGLLIILLSIILIPEQMQFIVVYSLLPTLGTLLVILFGKNSFLASKKILTSSIVMIGLISYPLYLWHWPMLSIWRIVSGEHANIFITLLMIVITFIVSWLTYEYIEAPLKKINSAKKTLSLFFSLFVIGCIGVYIYMNDGVPTREVARKGEAFVIDRSYKNRVLCSDIDKSQNIEFCFKSSESKSNIALIGDSHAEDKFEGFIESGAKNHWILLANTSCPPVSGVDFVFKKNDSCKSKVDYILNYLVQDKEIEFVVLAMFGNYFNNTSYAADHLNGGGGTLSLVEISLAGRENLSKEDAFFIGLKNTTKLLIENNKKVILSLDVMELPFFPRDCLRSSSACKVEKSEVLRRQFEFRNLIKKLQAEFPQVLVFDPLDFLCDSDACYYKLNEKILFSDSHHLSREGSKLYGRKFAEWLEAVQVE